MTITGIVTAGILTAESRMVFAPTVQENTLHLDIVSATFGQVELPEGMLTQIADMINQNMGQYISAGGNSVQIEQVEIANGTMTITGKAR